MRHLFRFLSTFGSAHPEFGPTGRQKRGIHPVFCLLSDPRTPILESQIDKNQTFPPFFVYFRFSALKQDSGKSRDQQNYSKADCGYGKNAISCDLSANAVNVDSRGIKSSFAAVSSAFSKKIGCMKYADGGSLRF